MLFSYNWIKEYIDTKLSAVEVCDRLTAAGIEVDGVSSEGPDIKGVVTAEIISKGSHPNADRLSLCEVATPDKTYSIVCGATNMKVGDKVALAPVGAVLPGGHKLKKSKIRGVASEGMMCSEVELGLSAESDGIMILPDGTEVGNDLVSVLDGADSMLDADILPNRPDCISIRGLAREIAAVTGCGFTDKIPAVKDSSGSGVEVGIESLDCKRYSARVIKGVKVGDSPAALKARLEAHGMRPVNNVVDATNIILLEMGQPLHAFDLKKLTGQIIVRQATEGESITAIDGSKHQLKEGMLVIADDTGAQAIAGIMGGTVSEVTEVTTDIMLESAYFVPASVRRTSRKLGLNSDSSYRFERGVDIESVVVALDRAAELIIELAGGSIAGTVTDVYPTVKKQEPISFDIARAERLLGMSFSEDEVVKILEGLSITTDKTTEKNILKVTPPSFRIDINSQPDLAEEIARVKGYENIPELLPVASLESGKRSRLSTLRRRLRALLVGEGFNEAINYSFVSPELIRLTGDDLEQCVSVVNPLSSDQSVMRRSLLPSLLENMRLNLGRSNEELRLFEVRPVYSLESGKVRQSWRIAGLLYGNRTGAQWNRNDRWCDFFDIKGIVERIYAGLNLEKGVEYSQLEEGDKYFKTGQLMHPGKSAGVFKGGRRGVHIGVLGELHPSVAKTFGSRKTACVFELELGAMEKGFQKIRPYEKLPRYPHSIRDAAFIVDEQVTYSEIMRSISKISTKVIDNVEVFDVYYGGSVEQGKKSIALRIIYRSADKTLKSDEVDKLHSTVTGELVSRFGVEFRS